MVPGSEEPNIGLIDLALLQDIGYSVSLIPKADSEGSLPAGTNEIDLYDNLNQKIQSILDSYKFKGNNLNKGNLIDSLQGLGNFQSTVNQLVSNLPLLNNKLLSSTSTVSSALSNQGLAKQSVLLNNSVSDAVNFFTTLSNEISTRLLAGVTDDRAPLSPSLIQTALGELLGSGTNGLGWLEDITSDGKSDGQDITVIETPDDVKFNLRLGKTFANLNVDLDSQLGLPGLGLTVDGGVAANLKYEFDLGFGINKDSGFYFDTSSENELSIGLDAGFSQFDANAKLGFLEFQATDNTLDNPNTQETNEGAELNINANSNLKRTTSRSFV